MGDELGAADPRGAAERLLRFLAGAEAVLGRVDDSSGKVGRIYEDAASRLAVLVAALAERERDAFVACLVKAVLADGHGHTGSAVLALVPSLDAAARGRLDALCVAAMPADTDGASPPPTTPIEAGCR